MIKITDKQIEEHGDAAVAARNMATSPEKAARLAFMSRIICKDEVILREYVRKFAEMGFEVSAEQLKTLMRKAQPGLEARAKECTHMNYQN